MKLSEMRQLLAEEGIRLTKSLGQNFLHDSNQLRRIVEAAEITRRDKVLEIGPGLGPLTEMLIERAAEVVAIEKDFRLVELLQKRFRSKQNLTLIHADALSYLEGDVVDRSDWKVVANLPYSVGSPILVELAQASGSPKRITVTLQMEVVQRILASVGTESYGLLTLLVQLKYEPAGHFKIPRGCFFPEPDVDSACVTLRRREGPLIQPELEETFVKIVKRSFSQRRKMMIKLLRSDWPAPQIAGAFRAAGVAETARAEQVRPEQFAALTRCLMTNERRDF
ncbi:MAG: 16S rRNA (adenine(1518)-N(6)/adenine(1519)-N(6))-dimethyltransferase RsmA [Verrucomicrobia subdivision 3 bacterium]|nr:16S rRNA (adenine(1518)-N(6)/adenine(1519)-N(6))-dimethyltransferase RsmA [Limisphaerales bacterium]